LIQFKSENTKHGKNRNVKSNNFHNQSQNIGKMYLRYTKTNERKHHRILPNTPLDWRGKPRGNLAHTALTLGTVIMYWNGSACVTANKNSIGTMCNWIIIVVKSTVDFIEIYSHNTINKIFFLAIFNSSDKYLSNE